jgi:TM2 domain-containing membrane protein YozV
LFLGFFGVHNFYRGNVAGGVVELIVTCVLTGLELVIPYPMNIMVTIVFGIYALVILKETFFETTDAIGGRMRM